MMTFRILLLLCLCGGLPNVGKADLILSMLPVGPTTVNVGDTVTIQLVASDPSGTELGSQLWQGFNSRITATTADPNDAAIAAVHPGFGFNVSNTLPFNTANGRTIAGAAFPPAFPFFPSANGDILATFSYVADVVGDTTFFYNNTNPGFNSLDLDMPNTTTGGLLSLVGTTITVNAVPEPSGIALLGFVGLGFLRTRRRK